MKPSLTLSLTHNQWYTINQVLKQEYPINILILNSNLKKHLGFTKRIHSSWVEIKNEYYDNYKSRRETVKLDFVSDNKLLLFKLKFNEFLKDQK